MTPILFALMVAGFTFGGALLGLWLCRILPTNHVDDQSRDIVRVSVGLVVTMTALILSLVVSAAKSDFDAEDSAVKQSAADVLALDQALELYGSETVTFAGRSASQSPPGLHGPGRIRVLPLRLRTIRAATRRR